MSIAEVINYHKLHKLDQQRSIICDFKNNKNKYQIAQYINKNIEHMDEVERKILLMNLLDDKRIKSDLLKYELRYLNLNKKISDFDNFVNFVRDTLKRYHMSAGGYLCEDTEWNEHDHTSTKYPLKSNEVIFENSIKGIDRYDFQITTFISDLLHFLDIHRDKNMSVSYRLIEYTDEIFWMIFKIIDKSKKIHESKN